MFRKILAAIAIAASPIVLSGQAAAQSNNAPQQELQSLLTWMAEFRPIAEGSYNILDPVDAADLDFAAFLEGGLEEQEFLQKLTLHEQEIQNRTDGWIARFEALPPAPELRVGTDKFDFKDSMEAFPKLANSLKATAFASIETYREAVSGDEESLRRVETVQFDKTIAFINTVNTMAVADKVLITDNDHPQLSVIDSMVHANNATINVLRYQRSAALGESETVLSGHLSDLRARLESYAAEIDRGKERQEKTISKLKTAETMVTQTERPFIQKVRSAIEDYALAWDVEIKMHDAFQKVAEGMETSRTSEALQTKIDQLFVTIVPLEEERQKLMFDRLAKMQQ